MSAPVPEFLLLLFREYGLSDHLARHIWETRPPALGSYTDSPEERQALRVTTEMMLQQLKYDDAHGGCSCGATWPPNGGDRYAI